MSIAPPQTHNTCLYALHLARVHHAPRGVKPLLPPPLSSQAATSPPRMPTTGHVSIRDGSNQVHNPLPVHHLVGRLHGAQHTRHRVTSAHAWVIRQTCKQLVKGALVASPSEEKICAAILARWASERCPPPRSMGNGRRFGRSRETTQKSAPRSIAKFAHGHSSALGERAVSAPAVDG